jgi:predicted ATPase/class 3 adenylate cyclase
MHSSPRTATFLFTDLENSTPLWDSHPAVMPEIAARHDAILREAIETNRGQVVKTTGDGFHAMFETASDGVSAALSGQMGMVEQPWPAEVGPLKVRMGLHTGEGRPRDGDIYGADVNRAARVAGIGHGGQVLLSSATAALIRTALPGEVTLADLGRHRLRGLASDDTIFQLCHPALAVDFPPLKSLSVLKNNLKVRLTTFIGRHQELADAKRLLGQTHCLTFLGPGGTGKTRLMLELAEEVIGDFEHGVWFVDLSQLADPSLIPERVAAILAIQEQTDRPLQEVIIDFLRHKHLLLLLDNVEHLVREAAEFAEVVLLHCPDLKLLVTGREALFIGGEVTMQIPSLSLPSGNGEVTMDQLRASEGVQLFVTRAQEVRPGFVLTEATGRAIAEIVRRLDGIPLALELAAARLNMLSVEQIAERLHDRFRLLTGGRRTALPRQQTLKALIDWSWQLLDENEQTLLCRLSVFSGGWSLRAAQAVTADEDLDEYDVFDLLQQLVNKSLVVVSNPGDARARYRMLESIRQYGRDRLFESGDGERMRDRHARYFVSFAEEAGPHLIRSTMLEWTDRIELELDNLRAVLAWTTEDWPELALRITANLLRQEVHWLTPRETIAWLRPVIERVRPLIDEGRKELIGWFAKALLGYGTALAWSGKEEAAREVMAEALAMARVERALADVAYALTMKHVQDYHDMAEEGMAELEEAIAISRDGGYDLELALALGISSLTYFVEGKVDVAVPRMQEARKTILKIDNPRYNAHGLSINGFLADQAGDLDAAIQHKLAALENYEKIRDRTGAVTSRSEIGHYYRRLGKLEEAERYYHVTIIGWQEMGHHVALAHQLESFAFVAIARGRYEHAAKLLGVAGATREQQEVMPSDPGEIAELSQGMERLAEALGQDERDRVMDQGSRMSLDEAIQLALRGG